MTEHHVAENVRANDADELRKLRAFKEYVHQRLDEAGIPTHPDGEHSKAGCRIGDRLDIALAIPDFMADIAAFHEKFGLGYDGKPRGLPGDLIDFRYKFQGEENEEWLTAADQLEAETSIPAGQQDAEHITKQIELQLDALVDGLYVLLGTAYLQGFRRVFAEAWRRVHRANMSKVRKLSAEGDTTDSGRQPKYDVVKPEGWIAPSHIDLIKDHAHQ